MSSDGASQILCELPGIVELGTVLDRAGRPGLGIEAELGGYLHELVFDTDTGRVLGEQQTLSNPEFDYAPWVRHRLGGLSREERVAALPDDAPSVPGPPCLPGQSSIMRQVEPGLTHATGRPNANPKS